MRQGTAAFALATTGVGLGAAFGVAAAVAPVYSSGETVLEANPGAGPAILAPLLLATVVWGLLRLACERDLRWPRTVARVLCGALLVLAFLGAATIGLYVLAPAMVLYAAAALTPVAPSTPPAA